jgi:hypothetical protein
LRGRGGEKEKTRIEAGKENGRVDFRNRFEFRGEPNGKRKMKINRKGVIHRR